MNQSALKDMLPKGIRSFLGKTRAVGRRLVIWWDVGREIKGVTPQDRAVLRRALLDAPFDVFRGLDRWRDPTVGSDCKIHSLGIGVFSVRARTDDLYHTLPSRELAVVRAIREILRPGDVFVDAGANIGIYSVLGSRLVGENGRVLAVEMMPETARILRGHLVENGCTNAVVTEGALSYLPGKTVTAYAVENKHGLSSIVAGHAGKEVTVETTTLKLVLRDVARVRLIKMDLEGAEFDALRGLGDDLNKVDAILYEDLSGSEVADYLSARGFSIKRLDGKDSIAHRQTADVAG